MKEVNRIFETKNYDDFTLLNENREIKESHVDYFVRELKENGQQIPFKINRNNEILEGQHRFMACKILNIPFQFFYSNDRNGKKKQLRSLINLQKGLDWSVKNHLETQCKLGNPYYREFKRLSEKHNEFTLSTLVTLVSRGVGTKLFKEGKLTNKYFNEIDILLTEVKKLKDFYRFYNRSTFVIALLSLTTSKDFDLDYFMHKAMTYSNLLTGCNGRDAYKEMLINLYNFKKKNKVNFYESKHRKSQA